MADTLIHWMWRKERANILVRRLQTLRIPRCSLFVVPLLSPLHLLLCEKDQKGFGFPLKPNSSNKYCSCKRLPFKFKSWGLRIVIFVVPPFTLAMGLCSWGMTPRFVNISCFILIFFILFISTHLKFFSKIVMLACVTVGCHRQCNC